MFRDVFLVNPVTNRFDWTDQTPSALAAPDGSTAPVPRPNFASLYCASHHLRPDRFVGALFWKTLFPCARVFGAPVILLLPWKFAADREFIAQVGQVETLAQYTEVENGFRRWPGQRSFLRGYLEMRVSSRSVRQLVEELLEPAVTQPPDGMTPPPDA